MHFIAIGSAKGIGRSFVDHTRRVFPEAALSVIDREMPSMEGADCYEADASSPMALQPVIAEAIQRHGPLSGGLIAAGRFEEHDMLAIDEGSWNSLIADNLSAPFFSLQSCIPVSTPGSALIVVSSNLASVAEPKAVAYCAAKAGLDALVRCAALRSAPLGIRIIGIAPGAITHENAAFCPLAGVNQQAMERTQPLGRFTPAAHIAEVALTVLTNPAFSTCTGTTIAIDGGDTALGIAWSELSRLLNQS